MKSIRVNADYESVLFQNLEQPKINTAVEFLALFLEEAPLSSQKNYPAEYLTYVEKIFGAKRSIVSSGPSLNWWGSLSDLEFERWLNSKVTSSELALEKCWSEGSILRTPADLEKCSICEVALLGKSPFDMSGRGFQLFPKGTVLSRDKWLQGQLRKGPVILEPYLERRFDFSHYFFPSGEEVCYENLVDKKFQYKGSLFRDWRNPRVENLSFYQHVLPEKWTEFQRAKEEIKNHYGSKVNLKDLPFGFSLDSFVYDDHNGLRIHPLCEVNFRRTMGLVAYELSSRYAHDRSWTILLLLPPVVNLLEKLREEDGVIVLSPPDARFGMIFCMAEDDFSGKELCGKVKTLLALGELPVSL